jgi:hypothetical protein
LIDVIVAMESAVSTSPPPPRWPSETMPPIALPAPAALPSEVSPPLLPPSPLVLSEPLSPAALASRAAPPARSLFWSPDATCRWCGVHWPVRVCFFVVWGSGETTLLCPACRSDYVCDIYSGARPAGYMTFREWIEWQDVKPPAAPPPK